MYKRLTVSILILANILYGIYIFNNKKGTTYDQKWENQSLNIEKIIEEFELERENKVELKDDVLKKNNMDVNSRDIFNLEPTKKIVKKKVIPKPKPKPKPLQVSFRLLGIMFKGGKSNAMFKNRGSIEIISENGFIDGYKIEEIRQKAVIISKDGKSKTLRLEE